MEYICRSIFTIPPVKYLYNGVSLEISYLLKASDSTLDVWQSSEYTSDSIINFILKYIPVVYITFLA